MLNESARRAGLPINHSSLLDHIGGVVLQIKLCSILQIIRSRFLLCYVNGNRLFGVDSALCFI